MILFDINFQETRRCKHKILLQDKEKSLEICLRAKYNTLDFSLFTTNLNKLVD
jgi:hypothetical protein